MYEPLKITAYPRCGIVTDEHLPIDGILLYAAMRERYGPLLLTTPGDVPVKEMVDLPLAKAGAEDAWYYAASFVQWPERVADGRAYWHKRADQQYTAVVDFGKRRGKINNKAGRYKSYRMPVFYRHALSVSWYVVGDRGEIGRLLSTMTHVGKKTAYGWGRIIRWQVEPWPEDWSVHRNGRLMRAVPGEGGTLHGYRPPYWLPENQTPCRLP